MLVKDGVLYQSMSLERGLASILMLTIPIPVFINQGGIFNGSSSDLDSFSLPVSLFLSIAISAFLPIVIGGFLSYSLLKVMAVVFIWIFIFLLGGIITGSVDPSLLLIYVVPIPAAFFLGFWLRTKYSVQREVVINLLMCSFFMCALIAFLHVVSSVYSYGFVGSFVVRGEDSIFGYFSIYQKLIYYPTLISCYLFLGVGLFLDRDKSLVLSLSLFIILIDILIVGSRESILISVFAICFLIYPRKKKAVVYFFLIFIFLISVSAIVDFSLLDGGDFVFITKWMSIASSGDYSAGRIDAIRKVFFSSLEEFNIFFGTFFSMALGDLRTPHNQYLEIFLRSGLVGISVFVLFIFGVLKGMYKTYLRYRDDFIVKSLAMMLLILLLISFNVNTPARAPLVSILFYTLCAFFYCKPKSEKS